MKTIAIAACALCVLSGCAPVAQNGGGFSASQPSDTLSCTSGESCQNIGLSHAGRGTEAHYAIAAKYFKRACDYGMDEGCNNLAFLYANARGVKQSYTQAYRYWGMACQMGNQSACANLELAKEKVAEMHKKSK